MHLYLKLSFLLTESVGRDPRVLVLADPADSNEEKASDDYLLDFDAENIFRPFGHVTRDTADNRFASMESAMMQTTSVYRIYTFF